MDLDGASPGSIVRELAQVPNQSTPETIREETSGSFQTPGDAISNIAHTK